MTCPYCNSNIPDESAFCNICGAQVSNRLQNTLLKDSAEKQLSGINLDVPKIGLAVGAVIAFISVLSETTIGFIIGFVIMMVSSAILINLKDKSKNLNKIANSNKIMYLCPKCKSSKIQMNLVQTGTTSINEKTLVSQNINPLRPFTHTNIMQGNSYTISSYANKCLCQNCGYIFDEPEKFICN